MLYIADVRVRNGRVTLFLLWPAVNSKMMYLTLHRKFSYELERHTSGTFINIKVMNTLILIELN
jgi:hypothetical protein